MRLGRIACGCRGCVWGGYDAAARDQNGRETVGYTLLDLLASVELPKGRVDVGVYNLTNRDYYSVFMQANARAPWPRAQGRTVAVSYSLDY
jgi:iron complex outermembrane recepter protein